MLPHEGRGEDGATAKDEEKESRADDEKKRISASRGVECETKNSRSLHETINERCRKTSWAHCRCESDEYVYFLVQLGVNAESGEGLGSPLTETNITQTRRAG